LESLRRAVAETLSPLVEFLRKGGVSPHWLSALSLGAALMAGYTYAVRDIMFPWLTVSLVALSGLFDILDGALARAMGRESKVGAFIDSTFDRMGETAIYTGILMGGYVDGHLVLLALAFSLIVSYERARAESLGVSLRGVGVGERAERLILLIVFTALSRVDLGVLLVLIISLITALHRLIYGAGSLLRMERAAQHA
jgi:archaetidylinositol phosphate synthase